jgi:prophage antirepressor-like protein
MNEQNALQVFNFVGWQVRVVVKDGEPWWVAKDVCDILELSDVSMSVDRLDEDEKLVQKFFVSGQNRDMITINESGLYALIIRSSKPMARKFRKWVTSEVLPTLRKTGEYATPAKQNEKDRESDELAVKRLNIMEKNANWRMAKLILEGIDKFKEAMTPESKTVFMAEYAKLTAGQDMTHMLPTTTEKWYSATEIGEMCGVSANKIGIMANENNFKAPQGESNQYGTWIRSKSRHSSKEVITWVYSEEAVEWFREYFGIEIKR